jgi:hypothetical protein
MSELADAKRILSHYFRMAIGPGWEPDHQAELDYALECLYSAAVKAALEELQPKIDKLDRETYALFNLERNP